MVRAQGGAFRADCGLAASMKSLVSSVYVSLWSCDTSE